MRPERKREDFLYTEARKKLDEELDILEIVKKLRVHQFATQMYLKPHQRELINFFQDYKVKDLDEQEAQRKTLTGNFGGSKSPSSILGGHRGSGQNDFLITNVDTAIVTSNTGDQQQ